MNEIRPCPNPKCGGAGVLRRGERDPRDCWVECDKCSQVGESSPAEVLAVAFWNEIPRPKQTLWRSLKTVPRDGSRVLLRILDRDNVADVEVAGWRDIGPRYAWADARGFDISYDDILVTHWQPLPDTRV